MDYKLCVTLLLLSIAQPAFSSVYPRENLSINSKEFELVTKSTQLNSGDNIVLLNRYDDAIISKTTTLYGGNREAIAFTDPYQISDENIDIWKIEKTSDGYYLFYSENGYLAGTQSRISSYSDNVETAKKWSISFPVSPSGEAHITTVLENVSYTLYYMDGYYDSYSGTWDENYYMFSIRNSTDLPLTTDDKPGCHDVQIYRQIQIKSPIINISNGDSFCGNVDIKIDKPELAESISYKITNETTGQIIAEGENVSNSYNLSIIEFGQYLIEASSSKGEMSQSAEPIRFSVVPEYQLSLPEGKYFDSISCDFSCELTNILHYEVYRDSNGSPIESGDFTSFYKFTLPLIEGCATYYRIKISMPVGNSSLEILNALYQVINTSMMTFEKVYDINDIDTEDTLIFVNESDNTAMAFTNNSAEMMNSVNIIKNSDGSIDIYDPTNTPIAIFNYTTDENDNDILHCLNGDKTKYLSIGLSKTIYLSPIRTGYKNTWDIDINNGIAIVKSTDSDSNGNPIYLNVIDSTWQRTKYYEDNIAIYHKNATLSGIKNIQNATNAVYAVKGGIKIDSDQTSVWVYSLTGQLIKSVYAKSGETIQLPKGFYIIKTNFTTTKVIVK